MSQQKPTVRQYVFSILAAAFGVQSEAARERDFSRGSPVVFIVGGLGFVAVFVIVLLIIVKTIVSSV